MNFTNIAGYSSEKKNLQEICHLIKNYDEITRLGLHLPTGILLIGEPGVGKTVLAEALIEESGVPCVRVNHSEVSSQKTLSELLRACFEEAARVQPSIVFLDEIEKLLGNSRVDNTPENSILLNAIQCYHRPGVLLLATANDPRYVPDSLRRSGRFDRVFRLPLPSFADRSEIILHYLNRQTMDDGFSVDEFARLTEGCSGADIECLINEIGIRNVLDGQASIRRQDAILAIAEKAMDGVCRPAEQTERLETTAYHEAGHLTMALLSIPDVVEGASIRAQGDTAGYSFISLPIHSQNAALSKIKTLVAGRCAERLFFTDDVSFGAARDYDEAVSVGVRLVMKESCYGVEYLRIFPVKSSDEKTRLCERKIEEILRSCEDETMELLSKHRLLVERLAKLLLEKYTLQKDEILEVYREYTESLADNH